MGAGELQKDVWHREAATIARRNGIQLRRWGMRVTVYDDSNPANNGDWVLSYGLASTNRKDNSNWLKVADIGATWGIPSGGGSTGANGLNGTTTIELGGPLTKDTSVGGFGAYYLELGDNTLNGPLTSLSTYTSGNHNFTALDEIIMSAINGFSFTTTSGTIDLSTSNDDVAITAGGNGELNLSGLQGVNLLSGAGSLTLDSLGLPSVAGTYMLTWNQATKEVNAQSIPVFENAITNTSGTVRWGGQLTRNTFVYSDGSARDVFFGYNPSFNEFPIGTFYVGATSSIQFNIGSTAAPQSFGFTGTGNFSFTSRTANTNSSNTQFMERRIISNGTPENNFGGREVVALEVASGASVGAVMHEYRLLDASGGGRFQWNVCKTYIGTTIPNTSVIQSFNTTDRTVSFFTKDDDFGGGTETLKIANTTLAPSTPVADSIMVYADDTSDNLSSIALYTEQSTEVIGATTPTHKLKVKINGTEYFLLLATV